MKNRNLMAGVVLGLAMVLGGCRSDCRVSCEKYQECVSADFDIEKCTDTCSTKSESNKDFAANAEDCSSCVEKKVCSEATSRCWDECLAVVLAKP